MENLDRDKRPQLSKSRIMEITAYYIELYKVGIVKTQAEICDDLMISMSTLRNYLNWLDLSENYGYLNNIQKIVLSQTNFTGNAKYAKIWRDFLEYQEEQKKIQEEQKKRYESHRKLSEILELRKLEKQKLKEARENLVKTLGKVYEIKHK